MTSEMHRRPFKGRYLVYLDKNLNKLGLKYQSYHESTKTGAFEQNVCKGRNPTDKFLNLSLAGVNFPLVCKNSIIFMPPPLV